MNRAGDTGGGGESLASHGRERIGKTRGTGRGKAGPTEDRGKRGGGGGGSDIALRSDLTGAAHSKSGLTGLTVLAY